MNKIDNKIKTYCNPLNISDCPKVEDSLTVMNFTNSDWNGYVKKDFLINERTSFIVCPKNPLPNNPWVWRTDAIAKELIKISKSKK